MTPAIRSPAWPSQRGGGSVGGAGLAGRWLADGLAQLGLALGDAWRVRPDGRLIDELSAWLAPDRVQVIYANGS